MQELYEVTVPQGQDIHTVLIDFIQEHGWKDVYICGAVGSVIDTTYNIPKDDSIPMNLMQVHCPYASEVVGFTGEVMEWEKVEPNLAKVYPDKDLPLFVHIHASCAYKGGNVIGGGLTRGKAFRSLRIFMRPLG